VHLVLVFDAFTSLLSEPHRSGKACAVLALYNISCDENVSEPFMEESMRRMLARVQVRKSLVYVIEDDDVAENVAKLQSFYFGNIGILRRISISNL
jgi:hypothetical protein